MVAMSQTPHLLKFYLRIVSKDLDRETRIEMEIPPLGDEDQAEPYSAEVLVIDYDEESGKPIVLQSFGHQIRQANVLDPNDIAREQTTSNMDLFTGCVSCVPFELPEGEKYDPPEGLNLCARLIASVIESAKTELAEIRIQHKETPSTGLSNRVRYYERAVGDAEAWLSDKGIESATAPDEIRPIRDLYASKENDGWKIGYPGTEVIIRKNLVGLFYINQLLQNPHKEIEAQRLTQSKRLGHFERDKYYSEMPTVRLEKEHMGRADNSEMELIDKKARQQYKRRLMDIQQGLHEANLDHDESTIRDLSDQQEQIMQELDLATTRTGLDRGLIDQKQKDYRNVKRAINTAISNIRKRNQAIADYLEQTIITGYVCIYNPPDSDNASSIDS